MQIALKDWELCDFEPGQGQDQRLDGADWIPVSAPGDTYLALVAAGRLDHPFQGRAETDAAWVRDREWWWRTRFEAPCPAADETAALVFEGLDTFATVYLDGEIVGRTDNMFRRWSFDIADRLKPGAQQVLAICFDPPALASGPYEMPVWAAFTDRVSRSKRTLMRKAQFGWGWDWGPDLPTVGVWQPARIEVRPLPRINDTRFATHAVSPDLASASISVEVDPASGPSSSLRTRIALTDPDGQVVFEVERSADDAASIPVEISAPRLWWTADLGAQPLYGLSVSLFDGERLLDRSSRKVGLRTIALDQSPDPDEPSASFFRFVLNGVPIFAKGACWAPSTSFVGDLDPSAYERLIGQAVTANMNMIRIWGGGIYEPDLFYDLCDRKGVLVWQDFMFACAHYPEDDAFQASVRAEVEEQVRRLRNHPCLALWCGNNENQAIHRINDDKNGHASPLSGLTLYEDLMPQVLGDLDPATPYWPSSPWGGPNPNSMKAGDVHDWTVWHGIPPIPDEQMIGEFRSDPQGVAYQRYAEDSSRFVSEFGLQAAPALATLERWMEADDLRPDSEGFLARIKDEARKADAMMQPVTGLPATIQDYVDFTQWCQAEGLKFGIEHFRRRRPHCSGALLWQFNDCWPCVSWSLVDYDGVEKAGFHAVRRAFAPVLASFKTLADGATELWISNDTLEAVEGEVVIALQSLDGGEDWRETVMVSTPSGGHALVWRGAMPDVEDRVLRAWSPDGRFEANRLLSAPIARLALTAAAPSATIARISPTELRVDLSAEVYLAFVHLVSDRADLTFSDNHFDLAAGETRSITVAAKSPVGPGDISVRCWNNRQA